MLVEGYDKCPSCGRPLKDRVLVRLVDKESKDIDFICFSDKSWSWLQKTAKKFGLDEGQTIRLFNELYRTIRILKMGEKVLFLLQ